MSHTHTQTALWLDELKICTALLNALKKELLDTRHGRWYLQAFDHGNDFHQGKLLLTGVIVSRGSFVLLRCARAVLVTEFICGMDQLPRVLK